MRAERSPERDEVLVRLAAMWYLLKQLKKRKEVRMAARLIVQRVGKIFKGAWKRHIENLGLLVAAAFEARRLGVAILGRYLSTGTSPKHAIKRVDRFLGNHRFDHRWAQERLLRSVIGPRKRVLIAVDWTKVRQWSVLVAAVIQRGRAVPVLWSVMQAKSLYKSVNAFEHGFFSWLSQALPPGVEGVVLLDRGFKRVALVNHLKRCGLRFIIRTGGNVHVRHPQYEGRMDRVIQKRGERRDLTDALLRPSRPVRVRVVGGWERGQREPWLLMTDLDWAVKHVIAAYGKRFRIEETFRDEKNSRFGLFLGGVKFHHAERLERMLLVAALVHFFAMAAGAMARKLGLDRQFRANTVRHKATHSDFTLGLYYFPRLLRNRKITLHLLYRDTEMEFWG